MCVRLVRELVVGATFILMLPGVGAAQEGSVRAEDGTETETETETEAETEAETETETETGAGTGAGTEAGTGTGTGAGAGTGTRTGTGTGAGTGAGAGAGAGTGAGAGPGTSSAGVQASDPERAADADAPPAAGAPPPPPSDEARFDIETFRWVRPPAEQIWWRNTSVYWGNELSLSTFMPGATYARSYDPSYVQRYWLQPRVYLADTISIRVDQGFGLRLTEPTPGTSRVSRSPAVSVGTFTRRMRALSGARSTPILTSSITPRIRTRGTSRCQPPRP